MADGSLKYYDQAIEIYRLCVENDGRTELACELASAYMYKGNALSRMTSFSQALHCHSSAETIWKHAVEKEGKSEFAGDLAMTRLYRVETLVKMGDEIPENSLINTFLKTLKEEAGRTGRSELAEAVNWCEKNLSRFLNTVT